MRTIADLKSDVTRKLHGTSLSKVVSFNSVAAEAARNVLARINPNETIRIATIDNAVFDDVTRYAAPSDIKGDKVIDVRPQVNRTSSDNFTRVFPETFDREQIENTVSVENKNGMKFLRLKEDVSTSITTVSTVNSTSGWSGGDNATNLQLDQLTFVSGNASLRFDVTGAGSDAYVENSTLDAVDLSSIDEQTSLFAWVFIPNGTEVTSFTGRIGSSASNYFSKTITVTHAAQAFQEGWNLLRFSFDGATEIGTVDWSAINYVRLSFMYDGDEANNFRIDSIVAGIGEIYEVVYYTRFLFKSSDGVYKEEPTADTDTIELETDAYNILLYELSYLLTQELQGENGAFDESYFSKILGIDGSGGLTPGGLYRRYQMNYPSQHKKPRSTYYSMPGRTYLGGTETIG